MMNRTMDADITVVGAGPAGIAAVCRLIAAGRRVVWVDQGARPGGQIWRASLPPHWTRALDAAQASPLLHRLAGHAVVDADGPQRLLLHDTQAQRGLWVRAPQLLLALGARERFLPFPGWTLPGVHGAGGLQALIKNGWPVAGRRVVLAGSGPLLLAAADTARAADADLLLIAEQASRAALLGFAAGLGAARLGQAAGLGWRLRDRYRNGHWVRRAIGSDKLEAVVITDGHSEQQLACDELGVGFGLLPNTELAELLGCRLQADAIAVDAQMRTSLPQVWAAGECTGIGGADKAQVEGELAALQMLDQDGQPLQSAHRKAQRFARRLARSFALRPELLQLAETKTLICRCEDVSLGALKAQRGWRDAKLQTRCGMGACQGRVCGPITQQLLGWDARGQRAPLQPAPIALFLPDKT